MLNKKGWGLTNEILFIAIFIICLIIAFAGFAKFGLFNSKENKENNSGYSYVSLEEKIIKSAREYVKDEYDNDLGIDTLIITAKNLMDKEYLTNYVDEDDKYCSGYVEVHKSEGGVVYTPYVKCRSNYESKGYMSRKDEQ